MQLICSFTPEVGLRISDLIILSQSPRGAMFLSSANLGLSPQTGLQELLPPNLRSMVEWWSLALGVERFHEFFAEDDMRRPPPETYVSEPPVECEGCEQIILCLDPAPKVVAGFADRGLSDQAIFESLLARLDWFLTDAVLAGVAMISAHDS